MAMFGSSWNDDSDDDDRSMAFSGADRYEERQRVKERAREIVSGWTSGMFERDDAVWAEVKKLEDK